MVRLTACRHERRSREHPQQGDNSGIDVRCRRWRACRYRTFTNAGRSYAHYGVVLALVETGWFAAHTAVLNLVFSSETNAATRAQTRVQSLFNSNYLGQNLRLLQTAYIPAIGIGGWWTIYVLTLHTVWSISMSIALTEAPFPDRETSPWLRRTGFIVTVLLFALGAILMTKITFKGDPFVATLRQLVWK